MIELVGAFLLGVASGVASGLIVHRILNPAGRGRIKTPRSRDRVAHSQEVRGVYRRTRWRRRHYLYLVVKPTRQARFFPQVHSGPIETDSQGEWTSNALVGLFDEAGESFTISLVAFDNEAQKIVDYYAECGERHGQGYVGLRELPVGSRVLDTVSVVRE